MDNKLKPGDIVIFPYLHMTYCGIIIDYEPQEDPRANKEPLVKIHSEFNNLKRIRKGLVKKIRQELIPIQTTSLTRHRNAREQFRNLTRYPKEIQRIIAQYKKPTPNTATAQDEAHKSNPLPTTS